MKTTKRNRKIKLLAAFFAAILLVQLLAPSGARAAGDTSMYIAGDSVEAAAGGSVSVPVRVYNNSGIMGLGLTVTYDADVFSSPSVEAGTVCSSGTFQDSSENASAGSFIVIWSDTSEMTKNGVLFTVTFQVKEGASGDYSIGIANIEGNTFDEQFVDINPPCTAASVSISGASPDTDPDPDPDPDPTETETVELSSSTVTATQNSEVTIPLYLKNEGSLDYLSCEYYYNKQYVQVVSLTPGDWYDEDWDGSYLYVYESSGYFSFTLRSSKYSKTGNFGSESKPLVYLTFKILETAPTEALTMESDYTYVSARDEDKEYVLDAKAIKINVTKAESQKKSSTVTLKAKTVTYTGNKIAIGKAIVTGSSGKVTYKYYSDSACKKTVKAANVINAGTYYVKATVAADSDYKSATSKKVKLVIKKSTQKIKSVKTSLSAKKNLNKTQTFTLGGSAEGKLTFKLSSAGGSGIKVSSAGKVTVPKKIKKGTYKIKVVIKAKATDNYSAAQTTKTITISVK